MTPAPVRPSAARATSARIARSPWLVTDPAFVAEVARQLATKGFHVFLSARNAKAGRQAAETLANQQQTASLYQLYLDSGISGTPRIDDPKFIPQIVYDQTRGVNDPIRQRHVAAQLPVRCQLSKSKLKAAEHARWTDRAGGDRAGSYPVAACGRLQHRGPAWREATLG